MTEDKTDLGGDLKDQLIGVALVLVAAVGLGVVTSSVIAGLALAAAVALLIGLIGLVVAAFQRSLSGGLKSSMRWTVGFVGRYFSF